MPSSIIILLLTLCSKVFLDNQVGSLPENPTIANVFYRSGLMESWGRGISLIMQKCEEAGLPQPTIDVSVSFVNLTIYFAQSLESGDNMTNVPQNVPQDVLQETSANEPINEPKDEPIKPSERQQIILDYLSHNPDASKEKMSQKLKISLTTLKRKMDPLKNLGALVREGGLKSGKWVVLIVRQYRIIFRHHQK